MNPRHEQRVKEIIERALPGIPVIFSSDVLPMIREWERTTCTVLSAFTCILASRGTSSSSKSSCMATDFDTRCWSCS